MNLHDLEKQFVRRFGEVREQPLRYFTAPGRVNLIGEHIDYCGGFVFPAALTLGSTVAVRPNGMRALRLAATDLPDIYTVPLDDPDAALSLGWGTYQAGVLKELQALGCSIPGCDMLYDSTLPYGSGLSSSAAIELSTAVALLAFCESRESCGAPDRIALARAAQRAENRFCGVNCGIMDQFASAMGKRDHAILLHCATLEYTYVPLVLGPYSLVLANSCKKHALGASKYNERRAEVERALAMLQAAAPDMRKDTLCAYSEAEFRALEHVFRDEPVLRRRAEHVICENARVLEAVEVLRRGDLQAFGRILCRANDSIRYLYEVTGPELDCLYDEAMQAPGCIGARMTGAGFGGCTVNIVETAQTERFCETVGGAYTRRTGITPQFYICSIGDGAREVTDGAR